MLIYMANGKAVRRSGGGMFVKSSFSVPDISFTFGVASSHDLTQYIPGWNSSTMTMDVQGTALPSGVTFNSTTYALDYDGVGAITTVSGILLVEIPTV